MPGTGQNKKLIIYFLGKAGLAFNCSWVYLGRWSRDGHVKTTKKPEKCQKYLHNSFIFSTFAPDFERIAPSGEERGWI